MDGTDLSTVGPVRRIPASEQDLRLAKAVLRKDRKASAEFVDRHSDVLYTYLHSRLFPRTDVVEDLLQEVFLAAWKALPGFEGRSSLRTWLLGIARHKVEEHYRSRLREPDPLPEEEAAGASGPGLDPEFDEAMDAERLNNKLREVLEALPERYRVALLWRYWEKRTAVEMADRSGRSVKAVERLLARARAQFRRRWHGE